MLHKDYYRESSVEKIFGRGPQGADAKTNFDSDVQISYELRVVQLVAAEALEQASGKLEEYRRVQEVSL
jgi:hypothetical protein